MKAKDIKIKATNLLTQQVYHFNLDDIDIDGDVHGGAFAVVSTREGKLISCFDFDKYDFEVEND